MVVGSKPTLSANLISISMNKTVLAVGLSLLSPLAWGQVVEIHEDIIYEYVLVPNDRMMVDSVEDSEDTEDVDNSEYSEFVDDLENSDDVDNLEGSEVVDDLDDVDDLED